MCWCVWLFPFSLFSCTPTVWQYKSETLVGDETNAARYDSIRYDLYKYVSRNGSNGSFDTYLTATPKYDSLQLCVSDKNTIHRTYTFCSNIGFPFCPTTVWWTNKIAIWSCTVGKAIVGSSDNRSGYCIVVLIPSKFWEYAKIKAAFFFLHETNTKKHW